MFTRLLNKEWLARWNNNIIMMPICRAVTGYIIIRKTLVDFFSV